MLTKLMHFSNKQFNFVFINVRDKKHKDLFSNGLRNFYNEKAIVEDTHQPSKRAVDDLVSKTT